MLLFWTVAETVEPFRVMPEAVETVTGTDQIMVSEPVEMPIVDPSVMETLEMTGVTLSTTGSSLGHPVSIGRQAKSKAAMDNLLLFISLF